MKFNLNIPLASSILHSLTTKSTTEIRDQYNNLIEVPKTKKGIISKRALNTQVI